MPVVPELGAVHLICVCWKQVEWVPAQNPVSSRAPGEASERSHSHSHSQWFAGKEATTNALGDYDEDDEEAENMMADLRILNLSSGEVLVQEAPKGAAAKAKANTKTKTKPATTKTKTTSSSVSSSKNGSTENEKDKSGGVETLKSVNLSF
mmetsp:Transcript_3007/g.7213  ORF Transcript_3007/g.7213 Transcript_3007/m.7213 type:complete len:151 (-) Transcript_3007:226-678(-)